MKMQGMIIGLGLLIVVGAGVGAACLRRSAASPESERTHRPPWKEAAPKSVETDNRPDPALPAGPPPERKAGTATPAIPPSDDPQASERFWGDVGILLEARQGSDPAAHRESVLAETVLYLGLARPQTDVFQACSRQALAEIEQAWAVREEGWLAVSSNPGLDEATREQMEQEIQDRYEAAKRGSLARVESALGDVPRARELVGRLEEWIDALR